MYIVYKAICKENGKIYIGVTSGGLEKKISWHIAASKNSPRSAFHKALSSGKTFDWSIESSFNIRHKAINHAVNLIKSLKTFQPQYGYNKTLGGVGVEGYKPIGGVLMNINYTKAIKRINKIIEKAEADGHKECSHVIKEVIQILNNHIEYKEGKIQEILEENKKLKAYKQLAKAFSKKKLKELLEES